MAYSYLRPSAYDYARQQNGSNYNDSHDTDTRFTFRPRARVVAGLFIIPNRDAFYANRDYIRAQHNTSIDDQSQHSTTIDDHSQVGSNNTTTNRYGAPSYTFLQSPLPSPRTRPILLS